MKSSSALVAGASVFAFAIAASSGQAAGRKPAALKTASASASQSASSSASAKASASASTSAATTPSVKPSPPGPPRDVVEPAPVVASASTSVGFHHAALGFEVGARIPWGSETNGTGYSTSLPSLIGVAIPLRGDIHIYTWSNWYIGITGEWAWLYVDDPRCNGECIGSNWMFSPIVIGFQPAIQGWFGELSVLGEVTGIGQNRPDSPSSLHMFGILGEMRVGYDFLMSDQLRFGVVLAGSGGAYFTCVSTVNTTQVACTGGSPAPHGWITLGLRSLFRL